MWIFSLVMTCFFADKAPRAAPRMKEDDSDKLTKQLHTYFLGELG